jgi:very-short-patch-repair endonuclease
VDAAVTTDGNKTAFARRLRQEASRTEKILWSLLRRRGFDGFRFRRQQRIDPYIVDFYCSAAKLVIELDGSQHTEEKNIAHDAMRTAYLEGLGYRVLRDFKS